MPSPLQIPWIHRGWTPASDGLTGVDLPPSLTLSVFSAGLKLPLDQELCPDSLPTQHPAVGRAPEVAEGR